LSRSTTSVCSSYKKVANFVRKYQTAGRLWGSYKYVTIPNMNSKKTFSPTNYSKNNPKKAKLIKKAVSRGMKQYAETFRKLANI
jgi:hypothetical protein